MARVDNVIPFNRPPSPPTLRARLEEVIQSGHHSGDGPMSRRARVMLEELHPGCAAVFLTTSCTHALELSALTADVGPDVDVILPSFTFVSTANAFALRGARLRFADIDADTLNISPRSVAELISDRTGVIAPVHYAGFGCDMEALGAMARSVGAVLIEDNAHGLFGKAAGRELGTAGAMSTLSFHETKNISSGEGGALVINDPGLVDRAEVAREKGTNRSQYFRGLVDKYTWVDLGSSWLPSEFTAAAIVAGLEHAPVSQLRRQQTWRRYHGALADWAAENDARLPVLREGLEHPAHMFFLLLPDLGTRDAFIRHMGKRDVHVVFHYVPLHSTEPAKRFAARDRDCSVTASISERLVRLPLFSEISEDEVSTVIEAVLSFSC